MQTNRRRLRRCGQVLRVMIGWVAGSGCAASPGPVSPAPVRPTRRYELRITATPPGCRVRIDGEAVGTPPVKRSFDRPAAVSVLVAAPGYRSAVLKTDAKWWLRSAAAQAAARFGRPVIVRTFHARLDPRVVVRLASEPPGARVTVNGDSAGATPTEVRWDGRRRLAIRWNVPAYAPHTEILDRRWWDEHAATAMLDEHSDAYVVGVAARLWKPAPNKWTRIGHTRRNPGKVKLAVQRGSSRRTVPATVVGPGGRRDVLFLFDTGATYMTLDAETAAAIGLDFTKATVELEARTANGVVTRPVVLLPEVRVGQHTVRNVAVSQCDSCRNGDLVGLLGLNVLQEFSTNVSPDGRQITLNPSNHGAGRMLSLKAFLKVSLLGAKQVRVANRCDRPMVGVVLELVQRNAAGTATARVRTGRFSIPGGESESVDVDLSRLAPDAPTEVLVVAGDWR